MAKEFGQAVRRWRERIRPEAVGLPATGHRRTAGLRREELATLAGISVDYVVRLEQGHATNPSPQIVEALARALHLSDEERAYLYESAGLAPPGPDMVPVRIPPSVLRMIDRLDGAAVAVHDAAWTLLLANPLYTALVPDAAQWRGRERNAVWRVFMGTGSTLVRRSPEEQADFEEALAGDLRTTAGRYPADRALKELIAELRAGSPRFAELWDSGTVDRQVGGRKTFDHPEVGSMTLDCDILSVAGSDLRIIVYTAEPGTPDAERFARLARRSMAPAET
ncbi:helix-turn-helix transcriptional regulator [Nonomuraea sp. N2-4H]|jgi:transcriptional regulator with XRE-family HTH domain|uniref:helix-turn-helix transcriptional regulator n=1 Tax=unclassified Nonomuraea TaxID=2593643 RepID=UPI0032475962